MKRLLLSDEVRQDIEGIWLFTMENWGQAQADRYVAGITGTFEKLTDATIVSRAAEGTKPGLRKAPVGRHVVFFRESAEVVEVVRVLLSGWMWGGFELKYMARCAMIGHREG